MTNLKLQLNWEKIDKLIVIARDLNNRINGTLKMIGNQSEMIYKIGLAVLDQKRVD